MNLVCWLSMLCRLHMAGLRVSMLRNQTLFLVLIDSQLFLHSAFSIQWIFIWHFRERDITTDIVGLAIC